jgi:DNA-binding sugar fermentation-stimulating protein
MSDMSNMSTTNDVPCLELSKLYKAKIIKRPSKHIKSPYVADIEIVETGEVTLGHTPSLGCCGLVETGEYVYVYNIEEFNKHNNKKHTDTKCKYRIVIASQYDNRKEDNISSTTQLIGIAPKMAEQITKNLLSTNRLPFLDVYNFRPEVKMENSRFDFMGKEQDNTTFILEVKNVPLADFEDISKKDRKKCDYSDMEKWKWDDKVAYFPDGYRKKSNAPVSERAIKHLNELRKIKNEARVKPTTVQTRCIMLYVIQRTDIKYFTPSIIDPYYREAYKEAISDYVEAYAICIEWKGNKAYYVKEIEIKF